MRVLKWAFRVLILLILIAAGLALWKRDELYRLSAVNSLFEEDRIVSNFSNMDALFWTTPLDRGTGPVSPLPIGPTSPLPQGASDWMSERAVTALVVLKDGQIRHQGYYQGTSPEDRRISWSMAKSFLAALFGIVLEEGAIVSMQDPVTKYAPQLAGNAYEGARIIDVLHMASGVTFDEDYLDFNSDINRMGRILALGGSMDGFTAGLRDREATPGDRWKYVSIDTHVISMVLRGATGRSLAELMTEKLIQPLGLEETPLLITDGHDVGFALGGLNMRTRDYARFGQMVMQDGIWQGQRLLPEGWVDRFSTFSAPTAPGQLKYGLQWWGPEDAMDGEFYAIGVYGQYIYLDRARNVVIAMNSADRKFKESGVNRQNIEMFRRIASQLSEE